MGNIRLVGATGRGVISGNHGSMVQLVKTRDRFNSRCRSMATRGGFFIMLALLSIPLVAWSTQKLVAQQAPDFALKSIAGENMRLSEYRGEVVMVTFWSTWCGRCRDQLPVVDDLYMSHRDQGFKVLSVSIDDDIRRTRDTAADLRLQIPVLFDEHKSASRLYDLETLPQIVLVDQTGVVRHVHAGYRRGDERLYRDEVTRMLAE